MAAFDGFSSAVAWAIADCGALIDACWLGSVGAGRLVHQPCGRGDVEWNDEKRQRCVAVFKNLIVRDLEPVRRLRPSGDATKCRKGDSKDGWVDSHCVLGRAEAQPENSKILYRSDKKKVAKFGQGDFRAVRC